MPQVTMPDGTLVEMPENPTLEQLDALRNIGKKSFGQQALDKLKLVGSAALRGAAALPAMVIDMNSFGEDGKPLAGMPASDAVRGFGAQPKSRTEKYINAGVEGVVGAVTGPGGAAAPVRNAVAGLTSGLGAEAAGQATQDNPLMRLLGGLGGGVGGAAVANRANRVAPQVSTLAKEGLEGITSDQLARASRMRAAARNRGVDMDLAQALEGVGVPPNNLTTIRNILANSTSGGRVQAGLRSQPTQLELLADTSAARIPGPVVSKDSAANLVQDAATQSVANAKKARSAAVRADYAAAGDLDPSVRTEMLNILTEGMTKPGATAATIKGAKRASAELKKAPSTGQPMLHALDYDTMISSFIGPFKGTPMTVADPKSYGQAKGMAKQMNQLLKDSSPELRRAEEKFAQISRDVVNPLKQGPTGQLATRAGYLDDVQASASRLESRFGLGSDSQVAENSRDIVRLAKELKAANPDAFPAAVKQFIRGRLDKAFESAPEGGTANSGEAAGKLWNTLFANRAQWQGMRDMAAGVARSYDLPEKDVVRGLENLAQITKALKSRPGSVSGAQPREVFEMGGKTYGADALRIYGFLPFEKAARKLEDATLRRTFTEFDRLLTTPEGAQVLQQLGKTPVMSNKAVMLLGTFYGTAPNLTGQEE